jgi:hypothetical protein
MVGPSPSRVILLGSYVGNVFTGVTTGTRRPVDARAAISMAFYLTSVGVTSGGTIAIEEADWDPDKDLPFTGTWAQMVTAVSASTFSAGLQAKTLIIGPSTFAFVRVRISADITGGGAITAALRMR